MPTLTLHVDPETFARLEAHALRAQVNPRARTSPTIEGQAERFLVLGLNKDASTTKHAAKDAAADAGAEVSFQRRQPLHPEPRFTAAGTEREVSQWAAHAPAASSRRRRVARRAGVAPATPTPGASSDEAV